MSTDGNQIAPGDLLRIERRYVVDGQVASAVDEGRYAGIERVGSAEHLVLRDARSKGVRLFPLSAISEITLVKVARKARKAAAPVPAAAPSWDPSFA